MQGPPIKIISPKIRKLLLIHRLKLSGIIHNSKTIMAISMTIQTKPSNILLKIITKINNELGIVLPVFRQGVKLQ